MSRRGLLLSLFPGIGILDRGFEEEGFCVVRGPDLLWGGDVKVFHPPAGVFDGVVGGPPCQAFSTLRHMIRHVGGALAEDLIPEFERVVAEAQPPWFVMENVVTAPIPQVPGYTVDAAVLDNRWLGGVQSRKHRFSFGTRDGRRLLWDGLATMENPAWEPRVMASGTIANGHVEGRRNMSKVHRTWAGVRHALELQGLPGDYLDHTPFRMEEAMRVVGNAVALPMAKCLARAVVKATEKETAAGWTGVVPAGPHKPVDAGSSPAPATMPETGEGQ